MCPFSVAYAYAAIHRETHPSVKHVPLVSEIYLVLIPGLDRAHGDISRQER